MDAIELKPSRFDVALCDPSFLNTLSSNRQVSFLMECVRQAYFGMLDIQPRSWADLLSTSPALIRKYIRIFEDEGILTHIRGHQYYFNYYRDMRKDQKGYVKLYEFLLSKDFLDRSISFQRITFYFLKLYYTEQSSYRPQPRTIHISDWYGRGEKYESRLFPINNREELISVLEELKDYFILDTSKLSSHNFLYLKGLKPEYEKEARTNGKHLWLMRYLSSYDIYYHEYHIQHIMNVIDMLEAHLGWQFTIDLFDNALREFRYHRSSVIAIKFEWLIGQAPSKESVERNFSEPTSILLYEYIAPAFRSLAETINRTYHQVEVEASTLENIVKSYELEILKPEIDKKKENFSQLKLIVIGFSNLLDKLYLNKVEQLLKSNYDIDQTSKESARLIRNVLNIVYQIPLFHHVQKKVSIINEKVLSTIAEYRVIMQQASLNSGQWLEDPSFA